MSSTDQIVTLFESLSFAEKLSLNERLATAMRKEGGGAAAGKKRGPKAKADGEAKPKRKAALGTLAWMAYVKHIKTTQPDALDGLTKEAEKLGIIKGIRAEDPEGYNAFVAAWKEEHKDDASSSEAASEAEAEAEDEAEDESAAAPAPAAAPAAAAAPKALSPSEKIAAMRAAKAAATPAAAKGGAGSAAAAAAPKATPTKAAKAEAKAPGAPKKEVKKAAAAKKEELKMPVVTIDGADYWHDPESNGLWEKTGDVEDGSGPWIGYWQPDDAENPIRFTENFGDE